MPEIRLSKARKTLPKGYQFGDAGKPAIRIRFLKPHDIKVNTQPPQLARLSYIRDGTVERFISWNDMERGEY